jgi:hypothetical protein
LLCHGLKISYSNEDLFGDVNLEGVLEHEEEIVLWDLMLKMSDGY